MGRSREEQEVIDRFWDGLPVREATEPLTVRITKRDSRGAEAGAPIDCAIARACRRMYGSQAMAIFRRVAYVDIADALGNRVVYRYQIPVPVRRMIAQYDTNGAFPTGAIELRPMEPSRTLDSLRRGYHRRKKAIIKGEAVRGEGPKTPRKTPISFDAVRNGSGLVYFDKNA